jgi:hypothetical protein
MAVEVGIPIILDICLPVFVSYNPTVLSVNWARRKL